MITFKPDVDEKEFIKRLKKLIRYTELEEKRHYEEWYSDVSNASKIPLDRLEKTHIYYSIRYIKEALK
jgi:hypothetical protein